MCKTMASHKQILRSLRNNGPVRRNLFGPVDREQLQLEYQDALRKDLEDASRRWGFDFVSEKPLDGGDFQWESISAKVPLLDRSCTLGQGHLKGQRVVEVAVNSRSESQKENILRTPQRCVFNHQNLEETPEKEQEEEIGKLKRKQTKITDFYPAKRSKMLRVQVNHNKFTLLHSGETNKIMQRLPIRSEGDLQHNE